MNADREPTAAEVLEWRRDDVFLPEAEATTEEFPSLRNISAGFIFSGVVRPLEPAPPEYVTLSMRPESDRKFVAALPVTPADRSPGPAATVIGQGSGSPPIVADAEAGQIWASPS